MRITRVNFTDFFRSIMVEYFELKKFFLSRSQYQLVGWERKKALTTLNIRILGTANFFSMTPEEVLTDDKLVNGFVGCDIRTITYLAKISKTTHARYRLVSQSLNQATGEITFAIYDSVNNIQEKRTLAQVRQDSEMIKNLNGSDGQIIGFLSAMALESIALS